MYELNIPFYALFCIVKKGSVKMCWVHLKIPYTVHSKPYLQCKFNSRIESIHPSSHSESIAKNPISIKKLDFHPPIHIPCLQPPFVFLLFVWTVLLLTFPFNHGKQICKITCLDNSIEYWKCLHEYNHQQKGKTQGHCIAEIEMRERDGQRDRVRVKGAVDSDADEMLPFPFERLTQLRAFQTLGNMPLYAVGGWHCFLLRKQIE